MRKDREVAGDEVNTLQHFSSSLLTIRLTRNDLNPNPLKW